MEWNPVFKNAYGLANIRLTVPYHLLSDNKKSNQIFILSFFLFVLLKTSVGISFII